MEGHGDERVLVLAPVGRDAELACRVLGKAGIACEECADVGALCDGIARGAGAILLAEEALTPDYSGPLAALLKDQRAWSDLPVVLLTSEEDEISERERDVLVGRLGNVTVIERPLRILTLLSAVRAALRARARQYAAREVLDQRELAIRHRDRFLAMLGHELRNPLSAILLNIQLMERGRGDRARQQEIIRRQAQQLARLVDDLLDVSRVSSGKIVLQRGSVELHGLLERSVQNLEAPARERQLVLRFEAKKEPVFVEGDAARLEQVFSNLLGNAIKYTPPGGAIEASLGTSHNRAVVTVRDTGVGIAADNLDRIFDVFVQVGGSLDRAQGGLGLGLSLVRTLVAMHGGTVSARSEGLGQGAEFEVRLPLQHPSVRGIPEERTDHAAAKGRLVLLVEDNVDNRDSMTMALEGCGARVVTAADGLTGVATALSLRPDVAVIDIGLPGIDGYEVARRIRAGLGHSITLLAITGYGQPEDRRRALDAGFDRHLAKPVNVDTLEQLVSSGM